MTARKPTTASPPADQIVTVSYLTDPTSVREGIEVLDQDVVTLGTKPWFAKRVTVRLEDLLVVYQAVNCRTRSHTKVQGGVMVFLTIGPQASATIDGLKLSPELLLVAAPGAETEIVVEAGYESIACMLLPEVLIGHLRVRGTLGDFGIPRGVEIRRPGELGCRTLFELGRGLAGTAEREPSLLASRQTRTAAQIEILEALLEIAVTKEPPEVTGRDRTRQHYSRIVKRAEAYAMQNEDARYNVTDLCRATGTSERTLQYAFHAIMAMTPVAYLRRLRLHRVRKELREAAADSTTVTAVALDWGFSHFGEFARVYKSCFDELPSETLRNQRKAR